MGRAEKIGGGGSVWYGRGGDKGRLEEMGGEEMGGEGMGESTVGYDIRIGELSGGDGM